MLDGIHMDFISDAVLSATTRLQQTHLRWKSIHLQTGLGQHGGVQCDSEYPNRFPNFQDELTQSKDKKRISLSLLLFAQLAILVLGPSVISIVYNFGYIFIMMRRLRSGAPIHDKEYATALAENLANPSHLMSFALVFSFWISWAPFILVRMYELMFSTTIDVPYLHFAIVWMGVTNSFWKIIIMLCMSPQFRLQLRVFCLTIWCQTKGRLQAELIGLDPDD